MDDGYILLFFTFAASIAWLSTIFYRSDRDVNERIDHIELNYVTCTRMTWEMAELEERLMARLTDGRK